MKIHLITILLILGLNACISPMSEDEKEIIRKMKTTPKKPIVKESNWTYWIEKDKMTDKEIDYAEIEANELINFNFPYQGGSTSTIKLIKRDNKDIVLFSISKGQIIIDPSGGEIRIKFDSLPPKIYSTEMSADYSVNKIFIENEKDLIKKLKSSKKAIFEIEFYESGNIPIEFNVSNLKWK